METLKVKMAVPIASSDWSFAPDDVVELDMELAKAWLDIGHAVKIKGEKVDTTPLTEGIEYVGFGYFKLSDGSLAFGKSTAIEAQEKLAAVIEAQAAEAQAKLAVVITEQAAAESQPEQVGDPNGAETGNTSDTGTGDAGGNEDVPAGGS